MVQPASDSNVLTLGNITTRAIHKGAGCKIRFENLFLDVS